MATTQPKRIETQVRNRKGQLAKECAYCTCPDGCGCEGVPHGCGSMKKVKPPPAAAACCDEFCARQVA